MSRKHGIFIGCAVVVIGLQIHNTIKEAEHRKRADNLIDALTDFITMELQAEFDSRFDEIVSNFDELD